MKHIHITLDLPLMPCLRLLIVWNECACLHVCLCVCVCVCIVCRRCECPCCSLHSRSQSCMSRHVDILALFKFKVKHPLSLPYTHVLTHMRTHIKRVTPTAHSITVTLHTLSHRLHTASSGSEWLPERLMYQSFRYSFLRRNCFTLKSFLTFDSRQDIII